MGASDAPCDGGCHGGPHGAPMLFFDNLVKKCYFLTIGEKT